MTWIIIGVILWLIGLFFVMKFCRFMSDVDKQAEEITKNELSRFNRFKSRVDKSGI
jgi:hypothetical protein